MKHFKQSVKNLNNNLQKLQKVKAIYISLKYKKVKINILFSGYFYIVFKLKTIQFLFIETKYLNSHTIDILFGTAVDLISRVDQSFVPKKGQTSIGLT